MDVQVALMMTSDKVMLCLASMSDYVTEMILRADDEDEVVMTQMIP